MCNSETITHDQITETRGQSMPRVQQMIRHANSGWTFHFLLSGEVVLPDGRRVTIEKTVAVRATQQIGRRPRMV